VSDWEIANQRPCLGNSVAAALFSIANPEIRAQNVENHKLTAFVFTALPRPASLIRHEIR
jgi:hypothetical protein